MDEARPIPPYKRGAISSAWYYCLECQHALATEYSMRTHCRSVHDVDEPSQPLDYTNGTHICILMERWDAWADFLAERFVLQVESLRGADDLAQEIGDGVPDEVFPVIEGRVRRNPEEEGDGA